MRTVLFVLGLTLAVQNASARECDYMSFLNKSITDGLKADGVSREMAKQIAGADFFKGYCNICASVRSACEAHSKLEADPAGSGWSEEMVKRLKSSDKAVRHAAITEIVDRYVEKALNELPEKERGPMKKALKQARGNFEECPCCNGACNIVPSKK